MRFEEAYEGWNTGRLTQAAEQGLVRHLKPEALAGGGVARRGDTARRIQRRDAATRLTRQGRQGVGRARERGAY